MKIAKRSFVKWVMLSMLLFSYAGVVAQSESVSTITSTTATEAEDSTTTETETKYTYGRFIPTSGFKTNLLYLLTASPNLGYEFKTGNKSSIDLSVSWNPFTFSENRKWKHLLFQPEYRFWLDEVFDGHFFGIHAHGAMYNVSRLPSAPFTEFMANNRFQGWLAGAGLTYGYRWNFSGRWSIEASLGLGYAYMDYERFNCIECGEKLADETHNYFGPTKASVALLYSFGTRKKIPVQPPVEPDPEPVEYEPTFVPSFLKPYVETEKVRSEVGQAHLGFKVGSYKIEPEFENNAEELNKVYKVLDEVMESPYAKITGIEVKGYACPLGAFNSNLTLSQNRAKSLGTFLKARYGSYGSMFQTSGRGEDWETLTKLVEESAMGDKDQVLDIIKNVGVMVGRETKLMELNGGSTYLFMKENMFPELRRIDCEVKFNVRPFNVDELRGVFDTKPAYLSLNEMFTLANEHKLGSQEFIEVIQKASELFPGNSTANLNAAAACIMEADYDCAKSNLDKVTQQSGEYWNNLGVLTFYQGDTEKALVYFSRAITVNNNADAKTNIAELKKHIESIKK